MSKFKHSLLTVGASAIVLAATYMLFVMFITLVGDDDKLRVSNFVSPLALAFEAFIILFVGAGVYFIGKSKNN